MEDFLFDSLEDLVRGREEATGLPSTIETCL
jgi:hypothetical protein